MTGRQVQITVKGASELRSSLNNFPGIAGPWIQKGLAAAAAVLSKHNLARNPTPFRTGRLLGSFTFTVEPGILRYYPTVDYALYVHEGTGRMTANPFLVKLAKKAKPDLDKVMDDVITKVAQEIAANVNSAT